MCNDEKFPRSSHWCRPGALITIYKRIPTDQKNWWQLKTPKNRLSQEKIPLARYYLGRLLNKVLKIVMFQVVEKNNLTACNETLTLGAWNVSLGGSSQDWGWRCALQIHTAEWQRNDSGMTAEWQQINVISLMWDTWKNCKPGLQFFRVFHTREIIK